MKRIIAFLSFLLVMITGCAKENEVTENDSMNSKTAALEFHSSDGGGPEYSIVIEDTTIVSYSSERKYSKRNHEELNGAGYTVIFTFTGMKQGETKMTIQQRSPIAENSDMVYNVTVADDLTVTLTEIATKDIDAAAIEPIPTLVIDTGKQVFYAHLEDNSSAKALTEKLSEGEISVDMSDYGNFEKVGDLPWELPTNDESITTEPGDIILYQGSKITIYYDENTWDFTRLARIEDVTKEELLEAFGTDDVAVKFWIEWSE